MTLTRDERDRFAAVTPDDVAYGEGACLETPPKVFELLHQRFKFDVDLTANEQNHVLPIWFGPGTVLSPVYQDALTCGWADGYYKSGFSNPPYGPFIPKILKKAIEERAKGFTSVFLLPMRAAGWFRDLVLPYYSELWYCSERLVFHYQGKPRPAANVKPTKALRERGDLAVSSAGMIAVQDVRWSWTDTWGQVWDYDIAAGHQILEPAGALFDSIIVVYQPYDAHRWGLFPPAHRPNIWEVKTGELRY